MSTFVAFASPPPGHLFPFVPTLVELARRGHRVVVTVAPENVELLEAQGLTPAVFPERLLRPPEEAKARTPIGAYKQGFAFYGERAADEVAFLRELVTAEQPAALLVDTSAWGASVAAEHSGLPWAIVSTHFLPIPSRDAPPAGFGLAPRHDVLGRIRDTLVRKVVLYPLERYARQTLDDIRRPLGMAPLRASADRYLAPQLLLLYTAEPFEYPRSDWPPTVRLVGPSEWDPPAEAPSWLDELERPVVLVTCSTVTGDDAKLLEAVAGGLGSDRFDVVVTTGAAEAPGVAMPPNVRTETFVPHRAMLERAACVVCHGGFGITQKALAYGVPVVVIPFRRAHADLARRVAVAGAGVSLPPSKLRPERLLRAVEDAIELRAGAERVAEAFAAAGGAVAAADACEALASS